MRIDASSWFQDFQPVSHCWAVTADKKPRNLQMSPTAKPSLSNIFLQIRGHPICVKVPKSKVLNRHMIKVETVYSLNKNVVQLFMNALACEYWSSLNNKNLVQLCRSPWKWIIEVYWETAQKIIRLSNWRSIESVTADYHHIACFQCENSEDYDFNSTEILEKGS